VTTAPAAPPPAAPPDASPPSKGAASLVLVVLAMVLLAASLLFPWWSMSATSSAGATGLDFGLTGVCSRPALACSAYGPLVAQTPAYRPIAEAFGTAFAIAALALVAALIAFLLRLAGGRAPGGARGSALVATVAGIAALAGPLYLYFGLPAAIAAASGLPFGTPGGGFFGGVTTSEVTLTYGGAVGWIASLLAALLLLVAGIGGLRRPKPRA